MPVHFGTGERNDVGAREAAWAGSAGSGGREQAHGCRTEEPRELKPSGYGVAGRILVAYCRVSGIGKVQNKIGANVRNFRKRVGLSQEKFDEKADPHRLYISPEERGTNVARQPKRGICGAKRSFPVSYTSVFGLWRQMGIRDVDIAGGANQGVGAGGGLFLGG